MRLTTLSDYALRVLMYTAAHHDRLVTIEETARVYHVSRSHLMKVVNILSRAGFLVSVRGRTGGFMLASSPETINLGAVLRATEPDFALVECFISGNQCILTTRCRLPEALNDALGAFLAAMERYTLADLVLQRTDFSAPAPPDGALRGPVLSGSRRSGDDHLSD